MKTLALFFIVVSVFACSPDKKTGSASDERNSEENVTENSGENISPQLEYDSANRTDVDTISNAAEAEKQVE